MRNFYRRFIAPQSKDSFLGSRELVLNYLLFATGFIAVLALINGTVSFLLLNHTYILFRLMAIVVLLAFTIMLYWISRKHNKQLVASLLLIALLLIAASSVVYRWGSVTPTGVLLFGLIIVMSGILLSARSALYIAVLTILLLAGAEYTKDQSIIHPDLSWMNRPSTMSDVIGFGAIYTALAVVSWLFNKQMEASLRKAHKSEKALLQQKKLLLVKVEERTRQLQAAQLERMQQLYRFAELGHISTALFHDLANHLTSVSIDIEGLKSSNKSNILQRIQHNIHYIDDVVQQVRYQIGGRRTSESFNLAREISEVIKILNYKTIEAKVQIKLHLKSPRKNLVYKGDATRFRQLIINLLSNAIDAYSSSEGSKNYGREVIVSVERQQHIFVIMVSDWGGGIVVPKKSQIFEPFFSTKEKGIGIGLFMVKEIVEKDLSGSIDVKSGPKDGTHFKVTIPHRNRI